jgi:glycosyltransferase involved in cell wall biosynthesis
MGERINRHLTVLQAVPALQGGGVERSTLEVAAALVRGGHRSLVVSGGGQLLPELLAAGSEHVCWPIGWKSPLTLGLAPRLRRLLLAEKVDILHARSRLPAWVAWLAWRSMDPARRPRFVTTVHGLNSVNAYSAVMLKGERVITVSGSARDYLLRNYPDINAERITVIPRGVDPAVFAPDYRPDDAWLTDWRRQFPQLPDSYLVTLPGRVSRRKGIYDFLDVLAALRDSGIPVQGLVVGGFPRGAAGPGRELRAGIRAMGLSDVITFTGYRGDVREIMAVSDVVVSLSRQPESFGRTVNEALALQVPVAGYGHGGVGEQLARHFPAGLVAPGDTDAVVGLLQEWYIDRPSMQGIRIHSLKQMLDSTLELYQGL